MAISASIQALIAGEQVAGSRISRKMLEELMDEGLLSVVTRGSRKSYRARDIEALKRFLIDKDESYRMLDINASDSRASMAAETGNSKLVMVRSCPGFPVNSYEPITCSLSGNEIVVNPPEGGFVFIDNWQQFTIPNDVVVVGIENMENFRMIRHQRKLFESVLGDTPLLFVSRYPQSKDLRKWLQGITNRYVHFGDFDLAGINIFLTEFQQFLGARSSFFIPSDIEKRLQIGSQDRYNNQLSRFRDLKCDENRIQAIIDLINKYHKCYDQEGYIMKQIEVVAAVILHEGRIFATQRGYVEWKDWWEFPGGKMESGETPEEALKREIREELATDIGVDDLIETIEWDYPKFHLTMHCYWCHVEKGSLSLQEHEAAKWLGKDELLSVKWLPADIQLIDKIRDRLSE
jgi:mutator protein MutT